jgi:NADH:ubiquinone oxidoreductase subunit F (NADH-binding)
MFLIAFLPNAFSIVSMNSNIVKLVGHIAAIWTRICCVKCGICRRSLLGHSYRALDYIIDVSKTPLHIAVVKHINRRAFHDDFGEDHRRHVGSPARALDSEEAQSRRRQRVQMVVRMRHQLVRFLCCGV